MAAADREPAAWAIAGPADGPRLRWILLLAFGLALLVRVGWVLVRYGGEHAPEPYPDETAYWLSARSLASGRGLRDEFGFRATYMPAYPAFLSLFVPCERSALWAGLAQAVLAAAVAPATAFLAWRFLAWSDGTGVDADAGRRQALAAAAAGAAAALDPFLVYFSGLFLTEAVFASVLVAAWAALVGPATGAGARPVRDGLVAGLLLLACVMLRPSAVFLAAAGAAVLVLRHGPVRGPGGTAVLVAVMAAGLLPWALRNQQVLGQRVWLTTRGGISLYDGFRPGADGSSDLAHTKLMPEAQGLSEPEWDRFFRRRAVEAVKQDPVRSIRLAGVKLLRTWSLRPNVESHRGGTAAVVGAAWTLLVLLSGAVGVVRRRRAVGACLALLSPVVVTTLLHMVFVGSVRYRVPVMPMLAVLGASCLVRPSCRRASGAGGAAGTGGAGP